MCHVLVTSMTFHLSQSTPQVGPPVLCTRKSDEKCRRGLSSRNMMLRRLTLKLIGKLMGKTASMSSLPMFHIKVSRDFSLWGNLSHILVICWGNVTQWPFWPKIPFFRCTDGTKFVQRLMSNFSYIDRRTSASGMWYCTTFFTILIQNIIVFVIDKIHIPQSIAVLK